MISNGIPHRNDKPKVTALQVRKEKTKLKY